jgi:tetratricopeptide (TPR) repeat protein
MADLTRLDDLKVLECALQDQLHAHLGRVVPFQVQCVFKEGVLWVLAQHSAQVVVDTEETFRVLEKTLQAEQPGSQLPVKLYLRKGGDKQPYSMENFTIYPSVKERIPREAAPAIDETELKVPETEPETKPEAEMLADELLAPAEIAEQPSDPIAPMAQQQEVDRAKEILDRLALNDGVDSSVAQATTQATTIDSLSTIAEETLVDESTLEQDAFVPSKSGNSDLFKAEEGEAFANDIQSSFAYKESSAPKFSLKKWLVGGGLGLLAIGGAGYGLSRPCVMGSCPQLQQSQSLAQNSLARIGQPTTTGKDVLKAQEDLHKSVEQLKTVPFWSSSYGKAQEELRLYSRQSEHLDVAVAGMKKASQASGKTSKQPVAQATWKESQKLWNEAIAELQKIPTDSQVYPLAQKKLQEYQQKLELVNQNITSEVNADKNLASARSIAVTNTAKQSQAKTLEDWQVANKGWKNFEQLVATVPEETTAHAAARKLSQEYQPQIAAVREKLTKEKANEETLKKAESAAADAKKLGQDKKQQESLASWNTAISTLQNVPQDSIYQAKAQVATGEYTKAMKQVESAIVGDQKKTQADASLKKICDGQPPVCSYKIENKTITVNLLPEYIKKVQQTATDATKQDDNSAKIGLIKHVSSLGDALESVSNSSALALQLYGADGKLIQKYAPRTP